MEDCSLLGTRSQLHVLGRATFPAFPDNRRLAAGAGQRVAGFLPACSRARTLLIWSSRLQVWGLAPKVSPDPVPRGHHTLTTALVQSWGTRDLTPCSGPAPRAAGRPPREGPRPGSLCLRAPRAPSAPARPRPGKENGPAPLHKPLVSRTTPTPRTSRRAQSRTTARSQNPLPGGHQIAPGRLAPHPPAPSLLCRSGSPCAPGPRSTSEPKAEVCGEVGAWGASIPPPAPTQPNSWSNIHAPQPPPGPGSPPAAHDSPAAGPPPDAGSAPDTWPPLPRGLAHLSASLAGP